MPYVYRHIRLDKNVPFYIGVGTGYRANQIHKRNIHWQRIVKKHKYIIEVMIDNLSWEDAIEKEKEFIKLYGRRDKGLGTLVNLTDGGEGMIGYIMPDLVRKKVSDAKKGINPRPIGWKMTEEGLRKISAASKGNKNCLGRVLSDETKHKIRLKAIDQSEKSGTRKPVIFCDKDGNTISEYASVKEAGRMTNNFPQSIMGSIKRKTHYGSYWKLKTQS